MAIYTVADKQCLTIASITTPISNSVATTNTSSAYRAAAHRRRPAEKGPTSAGSNTHAAGQEGDEDPIIGS